MSIFEKYGYSTLEELVRSNTKLTLEELCQVIEEKILKSDKVYQSFKERYDKESGKLSANIGYNFNGKGLK